MKPELERFFGSMDRYFRGEVGEDALLQLHPGWSAAPDRLALYGGFVRGHIEGVIDKVYPLCRSVLEPSVWAALVEGYRQTRPARHFELNQTSAGFPDHVALHTRALGLPPFLEPLARFEWTDLEVYLCEDAIPPVVERLTPNPTLRLLEHEFRLCDWAAAKAPRGLPEPLPELALLWRHPRTRLTTFLRADDAALLVLKLAIEGLGPEDAARAGGVPVEQVQRQIDRLAAAGMVLAPAR